MNEEMTKQAKRRSGGKGGQNKIQILPSYDAAITSDLHCKETDSFSSPRLKG
jgi:hypothetical protein